jgi:phosphoribosylformylglycinamidine (FGAM) synthase PurS component
MTPKAVAISLKIPDNEAYTALVALRRLGVDVHRVERSEIYIFDDGGDAKALERRVTSDETIFNPNKHRFTVIADAAPRPGEVWIEPLHRSEVNRDAIEQVAIAWRLFDAHDDPARREIVAAAVDRLLQNPAIEKATFW